MWHTGAVDSRSVDLNGISLRKGFVIILSKPRAFSLSIVRSASRLSFRVSLRNASVTTWLWCSCSSWTAKRCSNWAQRCSNRTRLKLQKAWSALARASFFLRFLISWERNAFLWDSLATDKFGRKLYIDRGTVNTGSTDREMRIWSTEMKPSGTNTVAMRENARHGEWLVVGHLTQSDDWQTVSICPEG